MSDDEKPEIASLEKVKPSWFWIKNGAGEASVSVTFLTIAFAVTTASYILSMFDHIGSFVPKAFDVSACSAYFIPLLTLYFGRKWTDAKLGSGKQDS
jgi:hypothetical protein